MRKRLLLLCVVLLVACSQGDNSQSGVVGGRPQIKTLENTVSPTSIPTVAVAGSGSPIKLQNVPAHLSGELYLTLDNNLYTVSMNGREAELVLTDATITGVRGSTAYFSVANSSKTYYRLNTTTGETETLFEVKPDQSARFDRWSPDGQWYVVDIGVEKPADGTRLSFDHFEVEETRVYGIDGTQVELPVPEHTDGLNYSMLFLADSTILVRARTTRVGSLFNAWHVNQFTGVVTHLDVSMGSQMDYNRVFDLNFAWDDALIKVNRELERYGLEIVPPSDFQAQPFALSPNMAYRIEIETGNINRQICRDYYVMQQPEEEAFLPRQLDNFGAYQVSSPILTESKVTLLRAVSPNCSIMEFQLELVSISNFDEPMVETLFEIDHPTTSGFPALNYVVTQDNQYLFWTAVQSRKIVVFLTEIITGETRQVLAVPYTPPAPGDPAGGTIFSLLAVNEQG